jgi:hypothetical protein
MNLNLFSKWFILAAASATVVTGQRRKLNFDQKCAEHEDNSDSTYKYESVCCAEAENQGAVCREISYVLLAVSGTLEEGFELRKNMDYRPFGDDGPGRVNATFLGNALVRGYKSFLDIKNPTWR